MSVLDEFESLADTELVLGESADYERDADFARVRDLFRDDFKFADVPLPTGLQGALRPYQHRGLSWMSLMNELELGACFADDMGLGKTIQVIAHLLHQRIRLSLDLDAATNRPTWRRSPSLTTAWDRGSGLRSFAGGLLDAGRPERDICSQDCRRVSNRMLSGQ